MVMARSFLDRLRAGDVMVADGAIGTNLQAAGLAPGVLPEEWVIDRPEEVLDLHRAFVAAGSDIILTCSFGGTRIRMHGTKYARRVAEINRRAAELARTAAGERAGVFVAGSLGPTGLLFEPMGELRYVEAVETYAEQAAALTEGGVDLLVLETMFSLDEAVAAIEGIRRASDLPLVCSFSYDRGTRTMMGVRPAQMVAAIAPLGVAALGANCGRSLDAMVQVLGELAAQDTGLPLWAKPNAGLPQGSPPRYDVEPDEMAAYAVRYLAAGAQIIGGCCGTTPAHVRVIALALRAVA
jgi:5-methyltetrahydrofolate--homocysteine methyltransferase